MSPPSISVCTTIFNEGPILDDCLRLFRAILEPGDEIVICDAGSTDGSIEIEKKYADIVIVHEPVNGKPITRGRGRQIATENASGDIVISTDGDVMVPEDYIYKYKSFFQANPKVTFAYGGVADLHGKALRSGAGYMARKAWGGIGCNAAFRRSVFTQIRGYKDINWWEDTEFYNDFPGKKEYIDNPLLMELDQRWAEGYWIGSFIAMTIGYVMWKIHGK